MGERTTERMTKDREKTRNNIATAKTEGGTTQKKKESAKDISITLYSKAGPTKTVGKQ
jgi:hypothetical protein